MTQRAMYGIFNGLSGTPARRTTGKAASVREKVHECIYSPHSLRATTATPLLDAREPIESVQDLLDHKHITTTQIYDKRAALGEGLGVAQRCLFEVRPVRSGPHQVERHGRFYPWQIRQRGWPYR
jgi:integrase